LVFLAPFGEVKVSVEKSGIEAIYTVALSYDPDETPRRDLF